mgnify:CR=1 FL=1
MAGLYNHQEVGLGDMIRHWEPVVVFMEVRRPSTPTMVIIPITCLARTGQPVQSSTVQDAVGHGTCSIGSDWVLNIMLMIMLTSRSRMHRVVGFKSIQVPAPLTMVHFN